MTKAPFVNRWDTLTAEELDRILDEAFASVFGGRRHE